MGEVTDWGREWFIYEEVPEEQRREIAKRLAKMLNVKRIRIEGREPPEAWLYDDNGNLVARNDEALTMLEGKRTASCILKPSKKKALCGVYEEETDTSFAVVLDIE